MITQNQKAAWTAALRSGDYAQATSYFERHGGYCCLGVLCVVTDAPTTDAAGAGNWPHVKQLLEGTGVGTIKLAELNDGGDSFAKIADFIDEFVSAAPDA